MKFTAFLFFLFIGIKSTLGGDPKAARLQYINEHKDDAIREMQKSGVPASITMAQACLESSDGKSPLAVEANNHFGIKCANWSGPSYTQDDDEKDECFRKYNTALESYDDHSNFLKTRPRYAFLFELDPTDYKGWAKGLKKAGYATDPAYADRLIKIIEDFDLHQLDLGQSPVLYAETKPAVPETNTGMASSSNTNDDAIATTIPAKENHGRKIFVPSVDVVDAFAPRSIKEKNGVKYVIGRKGDTYTSLARELNLGYWQLPKYNETNDDDTILEGQIVYIQPKKKEGEKKFHIVKPGETIDSISREYAIKERYLYKYNNLNEGASVSPGQKVLLQKSDS
jgi:LysM repeat protein